MSAPTTVTRRARWSLQRARRPYMCDTCRYDRIKQGDYYSKATALPGHEVAAPWEVIRECAECAMTRSRPLSWLLDWYPGAQRAELLTPVASGESGGE